MDVYSTSSTCPAEEAPAGYKQTEVGVIPEDWEVKPMAELFTFQNGVNAEKSAYGSGVPFINVLEVITHSTITETRIPGRITLTAPALNAFAVQRGDVLFNRTSETQEEVGLASVYVGTKAVVFGGFVIRARPRDSRLDSSFTAYALRSPIVRSQIVARGQGAVRANIGQKDLSRVQVFLPTKAEQEAIAEALSDVDKLLGSLEKLIAKKQAIKQATMQQLLSGKTRLPGFSPTETGSCVYRKGVSSGYKQTEVGLIPEDWHIVGLGEVCKIRTGKRDVNEGNPDGQYPFFTCSRDHTYSDNYSFDTEAILIAGNGEVGNLHYFRGKFEAYQRTYVLSDFCINVQLVWYQLNAYLRKSLGIGTIGSSIPYIKKENLFSFRFVLPLSPSEQCAIAAALFDMDTEIAALEQRRDKTRAIKQGMMQQLLTGRVRLVSAQEGNDHVS